MTVFFFALRYASNLPMRALFAEITLVCAMIIIAAGACPRAANAQSVGVGVGIGLPLMKYITAQTDREYRITPEPGYYPVLKDYENAYGSIHFNASLLLDFELPFDVEVRFDAARMRWRKSVTTHVSCEPTDVVNGSFSDAATQYIPLKDVGDQCLNKTSYKAEEDISSSSLSNLWFFHFSGGGRYAFYRSARWQIFAGAHLGFTIASRISSDTWFGGNAGALLGVMVRLSDYIWIEFDAKAAFLLTQAPDDSQTRINHETQTGGNIFTSLVQPDAYVDFQLSLRFDFSEI